MSKISMASLEHAIIFREHFAPNWDGQQDVELSREKMETWFIHRRLMEPPPPTNEHYSREGAVHHFHKPRGRINKAAKELETLRYQIDHIKEGDRYVLRPIIVSLMALASSHKVLSAAKNRAKISKRYWRRIDFSQFDRVEATVAKLAQNVMESAAETTQALHRIEQKLLSNNLEQLEQINPDSILLRGFQHKLGSSKIEE